MENVDTVGTIPLKVNAFVRSDVLMWGDDASEFHGQGWFIDQMTDYDDNGQPVAVQYHIRKRNEQDPVSKIIPGGPDIKQEAEC